MLPDEIAQTLRRTEALAVQSAVALCLAYELMQRASASPKTALPGLRDLQAQVQRVSETLAAILEQGDGEFDGPPSDRHQSVATGRQLN